MATDGDVDWATAELFAFGVDRARRGRRSGSPGRTRGAARSRQRHAVLIDRNTGEEYTPLRTSPTDQAPVLGLRLAAERVRRGRLRVRLLGRQPGGAGLLGGPVRRLRRRRADDHRRVHLLGRGQVGPALRRSRCCCRTATRARDRTTRPAARRRFLQLCRRGQHDGRDLLHPGELLPPAAPAGAVATSAPAGRVHPEVAAAAKAAVSQLEEFTDGEFRPVIGDAAGRPGAGAPGAALLAARSTTTSRPRGSSSAHRRRRSSRLEQLYPLPAERAGRAELATYP